MMAKQPTRAQDMGVSTKRLRRHAAIRIDRMERAVMAVHQAWTESDDPMLEPAIDAIKVAILKFESDLSDIAAYLDESAEADAW